MTTTTTSIDTVTSTTTTLSTTSFIIPRDYDSDANDDDDPSLLPLPWSAVAVVLISVAIVTAVGGNLLVVLSYRRDQGLRDVYNLYLLHLAVCDMMVGAFSMPLYLLYTVLYWTWPLGRAMCKLFLVVDFTACCMSTLVVILVAADRLALLTLGANYQVVETRKRAYRKLSLCWFWSFLLYSPAILFWDIVRGHSIVPADDCDVEFCDNLIFTAVAEVISFSMPFVVLTVINSMLFVVMKKRRKVHHQISGARLNVDKVTGPKRGDDKGTSTSQEECLGKTHANSTAEHSLDKNDSDSVPFCVKPVTASQQLTPSSQTPKTANTGNSATVSKNQSQTLSFFQASALSSQPGTHDLLPEGNTIPLDQPQTSRPSESDARISQSQLSTSSNQILSFNPSSHKVVSANQSSSHEVLSTNQSSREVLLTNQSPRKIQSANHSPHEIGVTNQSPHKIESAIQSPHKIESAIQSPHKIQAINQSRHNIQSTNQSSQEIVTASQSQVSSIFQVVELPSQTVHHASSKAMGSSGQVESNRKAQQKIKKQDRRAGAILAGLVLARMVFTMPYGVTTILLAACEDCVNKDLYEILCWLLWLRSCFNPFLYAYKSLRFRRNFRELLGRVLPHRLRRNRF